ncbi:MAG: glycosyltransferase [Microgenomates group bacterium]
MKTKVFIASSYYPNYLQSFYCKKKEKDSKDGFELKFKDLMADYFSWGDSWKFVLEKSGDYQVFQTVVNDKDLQEAWARENNILLKDDWMLDILEEQVRLIKPVVFFSHDTTYIKPDFRKKLKRELGVKKIITWDGVGFGLTNNDMVAECDLVLSCNQLIVDRYIKKGFKALLFSFGFDGRLLEKLNPKISSDISFVGSLNLEKNGHLDRLKFLSSFVKEFDNFAAFISGIDNWHPWDYEQLFRISHLNISEFFDVLALGMKNNGEKYGLDMFNILAGSKITLNKHIDYAGDFAGNIRLFEATGVGTCLLTDYKKNLSEIFNIGTEVMAYKSSDEALEMAKWLLFNDKKREQIALAGQKRTLKDYTLENRIESVFKKLNDFL